MPAHELAPTAPEISIRPWTDPVVDQLGHDPRSTYVERFWLPVLGPSTVWLLRRMADGLDESPAGFSLDPVSTARALGVGSRGGARSPLMRSIQRSCRFGAAKLLGADALAVRRRLPPLNSAQVSRLPKPLRDEHRAILERRPGRPTIEEHRGRARQLALSLLQLGEDPRSAERQLHRWRFHPAVANEAVRWAVAQTAPPAG